MLLTLVFIMPYVRQVAHVSLTRLMLLVLSCKLDAIHEYV
jgi:hypothetical protein